MTDPVVAALLQELPSVTHHPGTTAYRRATSPDNPSFAQRPRAVVVPRHPGEVATAVAIAARTNATVAVQSTGHGTGHPIGPDTVLIDTSALDEVTIDSSGHRARIGAGARWGAVQHAAAPHGMLGMAGTSPTVGVAGYVFSGGVGWFVRPHGLASARLIAVDYVDGTGRRRRATEDATEARDQDALWAFRGGGPVGIATAMEIDLVPTPSLIAGHMMWPPDALGAVASAWVDAIATAPPALSSTLSLLQLPPEGRLPDGLRGGPAVVLSYASPHQASVPGGIVDALRWAAPPAMDTQRQDDVEFLARIHLDPPGAVATRGGGWWLRDASAAGIVSTLRAARIGTPEGLNMVEVRHTQAAASGTHGALVDVPAPFLLNAVGAGEDAARGDTDTVLAEVQSAAGAMGIEYAAVAFRAGQPHAANALPTPVLKRLSSIRDQHDPHRLFAFHRHPGDDVRPPSKPGDTTNGG